MWSKRRHDRSAIERTTSELSERIQRLEREYAELRAQLEGERQLRAFATQVSNAGAMTPVFCAAFERVAESMRAPIPRGRAGGLARARNAWRFFDGSFMPKSAKLDARFAEYERYAAGGRARAATARRASDGVFLAND